MKAFVDERKLSMLRLLWKAAVKFVFVVLLTLRFTSFANFGEWQRSHGRMQPSSSFVRVDVWEYIR